MLYFNRVMVLLYVISSVMSEKCVTYNLEEDNSSVLFPCDSIYEPWLLESYSTNNLNPPSENTYTYMTSNSKSTSCSITKPIQMSFGGKVEINLYSNLSEVQFSKVFFLLYVSTDDGDVASDSAILKHLGNGWHSMAVTINKNKEFNGTITFVGLRDESSILLFDSFRYIPPNLNEDKCTIYEDVNVTPPPDTTTTGLEETTTSSDTTTDVSTNTTTINPTTIDSFDDCIAVDFEEELDSVFSNETCNGLPFLPWELGNYSSISVSSPSQYTDKFIQPNKQYGSCASTLPLPISLGGVIEANAYLEIEENALPSDLFGFYVTDINGQTVSDTVVIRPGNTGITNGWHVLRTVIHRELAEGIITFVGLRDESSILLFDSFRYIPPNLNEDKCTIYEDVNVTPPPDTTTTGLEETTTSSDTTTDVSTNTTTINPTTIDSFDDCIAVDFEEELDSVFSNETCNGLPFLPWELGNYSSISVSSPSQYTDKFIQPNKQYGSCASTLPLPMSLGGVIEANAYLEIEENALPSDLFGFYVTDINGQTVSDTVVIRPGNTGVTNGWHVLRTVIYRELAEGIITFVGLRDESSILLFDSFRYISPNLNEDKCTIYEDVNVTPPPDTTTTGLEETSTSSDTTTDVSTNTTTINPTTIDSFDDCITVDFEEELDSVFSNETCNGLPFLPWELGNYSSISVSSPSQYTDKFIQPNKQYGSCASTLPLPMSLGGVIEANAYLEIEENALPSDLFGFYVTDINGQTVSDTVVIRPGNTGITNGWHVLRTVIYRELAEGIITFVGLRDESSILLFDSFRYIPPNLNEDKCTIYEDVNVTPPPDTTTTGLEETTTSSDTTTDVSTNTTTINPTTIDSFDDCITVDFEEELDSVFSNETCNGLSFLPWELGNYSSISVSSPSQYTDKFIQPNKQYGSCASTLPLPMSLGGVIEANAYLEIEENALPSDLFGFYVTDINGQTVSDTVVIRPGNTGISNGWHVLRTEIHRELAEGIITFVGLRDESTILLFDSFRYIPPNLNEDKCTIYEDVNVTPPPDTTTTGLEEITTSSDTTTDVSTNTTTINPTTIDSFDDCITVDFEEELDSVFSNETCNGLPFLPWELGNYSSISVSSPSQYTDKFIQPNKQYGSCASTLPLPMSLGGVIEANAYLEIEENALPSDLFGFYVTDINGQTVSDTVVIRPGNTGVTNGWHVLRTVIYRELAKGIITFVGLRDESSILLFDSFRYIPPNLNEDKCTIYEDVNVTPPPDTTTTGLEETTTSSDTTTDVSTNTTTINPTTIDSFDDCITVDFEEELDSVFSNETCNGLPFLPWELGNYSSISVSSPSQYTDKFIQPNKQYGSCASTLPLPMSLGGVIEANAYLEIEENALPSDLFGFYVTDINGQTVSDTVVIRPGNTGVTNGWHVLRTVIYRELAEGIITFVGLRDESSILLFDSFRYIPPNLNEDKCTIYEDVNVTPPPDTTTTGLEETTTSLDTTTDVSTNTTTINPTTIDSFDDCITVDFEEELDSVFSNETCNGLPFLPWELGNYSSISVSSPSQYTDKFIQPNKQYGSCASTLPLPMSLGGVIEANAYLEIEENALPSDLFGFYVTDINGQTVSDTVVIRPGNTGVTNGWHVLRTVIYRELAEGIITFVGLRDESSFLLFDSFRYIPPNLNEDKCTIYEDVNVTPPPDTTTTGLEEITTSSDTTTDVSTNTTTINPTTIDSFDDCITVDFEEELDSVFSNETCNGLSFLPWELENYSSISVSSPSQYTDKFIQPNKQYGSCASTLPLPMSLGGVIEANAYLEIEETALPSDLFGFYVTDINGQTVSDTVVIRPGNTGVTNGWHVLRTVIYRELAEGIITFVGLRDESSILLFDSFRYIPPNLNEDKCTIYEDVNVTPPPDTTTTGLEETTTSSDTTTDVSTNTTTINPTTIDSFDDCIAVDFEEELDSVFSNETCNGLQFLPWELGNYSSISISSPSQYTDKFIQPNKQYGSCASTLPLPMSLGGVIEANAYLEIEENALPSDVFGFYVTDINGQAVSDTVVIRPGNTGITNGWHVLRTVIHRELAEGIITFVGLRDESSILLFDSFRYIPPNLNEDKCTIYEDVNVTPPPDTTTTGLEETTTSSDTTTDLSTNTTTINPTTIDSFDDCIAVDFEEELDSVFSNETCNGLPFLPWELGNYSSISVSSPSQYTDKFIQPNKQYGSCASTLPLPMSLGGVIEANAYLEIEENALPSDLFGFYVTDINGQTVSDTVVIRPGNTGITNGWHVLRTVIHRELAEGIITFVGLREERSILLLDSFRYIPPNIDEDLCIIYEDVNVTPQPDTTTTEVEGTTPGRGPTTDVSVFILILIFVTHVFI